MKRHCEEYSFQRNEYWRTMWHSMLWCMKNVPWIENCSGGYTNDVDDADLSDHWVAIDLTHVATGVLRLGLAYVQRPRSFTVVWGTETRDPRHQVLVDGHNHLTIQMNPRHLFKHIRLKHLFQNQPHSMLVFYFFQSRTDFSTAAHIEQHFCRLLGFISRLFYFQALLSNILMGLLYCYSHQRLTT